MINYNTPQQQIDPKKLKFILF